MRLGGDAVAFIWPCGGEGPEKLFFRWFRLMFLLLQRIARERLASTS